VFWLTSWIRSGFIQITVRDLLKLESDFPDLMRDVDTCIWQVELIKSQVKHDE
jgi:hypothetical protein